MSISGNVVPLRLNRLLAADGKALTICAEHGLFSVPSWLPGLTALDDVVDTAVATGVDVLTLTMGQAHLLQAVRDPRKPALNLRADVWDAYAEGPTAPLYSQPLHRAIERAVALDAACVVASLFALPGHPELHAACVRTLDRLRAECTPAGMPLQIEVLALTPTGGVPDVDSSPGTIALLVRQAVELGADLVKCEPTDPLSELPRIVEAAGGRPLIVGGGVLGTDAEVLERSAEVMRQGAQGLAYGRSIWRAEKPVAMVEQLLRLVHGADEESR
jgi:DhnA family fructose-bisphosphate aldolase class Ia